jgi:hypothetical protein
LNRWIARADIGSKWWFWISLQKFRVWGVQAATNGVSWPVQALECLILLAILKICCGEMVKIPATKSVCFERISLQARSESSMGRTKIGRRAKSSAFDVRCWLFDVFQILHSELSPHVCSKKFSVFQKFPDNDAISQNARDN